MPLLVALCILGQRHDNNYNEMRPGLTWCNKEVKSIIDIYEDGDLSHILETTHTNRKVEKIRNEQMRERGYDGSVKHCCAKIAISKDTLMVTSNLAAPIKALSSSCWVSYVLTTNEPLLG